MSVIAAVGQSFDLDGRKACLEAVEQAYNQVSLVSDQVGIAFLFASKEYDMTNLLQGAAAQLSNTAFLGFSSHGQLSGQGARERSVVAALLAGDEVTVRANWWSGFSEDSKAVTGRMLESLQPEPASPFHTLLLIADGLQGDGVQMCAQLPLGAYQVAGGMTGGGIFPSRDSYQIGGALTGSRGLAAALLTGTLKVGIGLDHGWESIGKYFRVTRSEDVWLRSLDGLPASESYAQLFGHQPKEWIYPPLNELVRLYPLGIEQPGHADLVIRSPLQVEVDGSFRMSTHVQGDSTGHLMVGSTATCIQAVERACDQALQSLGTARPVLALVFADIAWKMMFDAQPGIETRAIREIMGMDVPIAGGYTVGQISNAGPAGQTAAAQLYNQHIQIIVFGEPAST